ncbi:DinB family protein [Hymenobacter sp. GOD-10R]|uniref:DinB family protein n=1 Tax=Hymenobacter sp. GOD-10R TaxID=3093922 RepID=UPI002D773B6D|nr:DinB family protein [Hymenobacter sp. GOD-10R]WRQ27672.1 DinB family protein [Hymenobacter sp. GOD-10R]
MNSQRLFDHAWDTFKAFDDLTVARSGLDQDEFPTSIWQILQHLITWQAFQLRLVQGLVPAESFQEDATWVRERVPPSEAVLRTAVQAFHGQLAAFQAALTQTAAIDEQELAKQQILQEVALHLAFHLGEVVLIRRLKGSYPLPQQMKAFLQA